MIGHTTRISDSVGLTVAPKFTFLINICVMLILLIQRPKIFKKSKREREKYETGKADRDMVVF